MTESSPPPRSALRRLLDRWRGFSHRVARAQTYVLLTLVYGLIIIPLGLLLRLFRRSPLNQRRLSPDSAWTPREDVPYTVERFKRLF